MKKRLRLRTALAAIGVGVSVNLAAHALSAKEMISMTSEATYDVCNMDLIYQGNGYNYSLPRNLLEGFLSGNAFDNKEVYSNVEIIHLPQDIGDLFQKILSSNPIQDKLAVITAGAPGAGKTTYLHQELENSHQLGIQYAYICPDDVCLKNQRRTYLHAIQNGDGSKETCQAAYTKWRPGSNAATHLILAHLILREYAFYFGTTSSGPATAKFFEFLKNRGYHIRLIHITAPDQVRWEAIQERDKAFIQVTEQDVKEKGRLLPQRIMDTFLAYADEIEFYYRDGVNKEAQLAARWIRNLPHSKVLGTLCLKEPSLYEQIKTIHNLVVTELGREELGWEQTVEKNSNLFNASLV